MKNQARRNITTALLLLGLLLLVFGALFSAAISTLESSRATRAEQLDPSTAALVAERAPGREVLVEGKIDARTPPRRDRLVAYSAERSVSDDDGKTTRWQEVERITPAMLLALPDGPVQVVAGRYELDAPPVTIDDGSLRYRGFVAGSPVTVIGSIVDSPEGHAIAADVVFGGTRDAYIASRRAGATSFGWAGAGFATVGVLLLLIAGWRMLRR